MTPIKQLMLPDPSGSLVPHEVGECLLPEPDPSPPTSRSLYAAAHVVADPLRASMSAGSGAVDWEGTLSIRRHLWSHGLGVAEAMDTAQRGMGITWPDVRTLVSNTLAESDRGGVIVGVATDQILPGERRSLAGIAEAYIEQLEFVEGRGGDAVIMASRHLAAAASTADDYADVYGQVIKAAARPVILHWLGDMFDPSLTGYWGSDLYGTAAASVLELINAQTGKVRGIKMSLLNDEWEVDFRKRLPEGVRMFTGDDFNYPTLIQGDGKSHSDALLGAFAFLAPIAAAAVRCLDRGDAVSFRALLDPTVPLSRRVFAAPTQYYKTGVAWLSYLSGHQDHFVMLGGLQSGRSALDLVETYRLADTIGLFPDPDLAAGRTRAFLARVGTG